MPKPARSSGRLSDPENDRDPPIQNIAGPGDDAASRANSSESPSHGSWPLPTPSAGVPAVPAHPAPYAATVAGATALYSQRSEKSSLLPLPPNSTVRARSGS